MIWSYWESFNPALPNAFGHSKHSNAPRISSLFMVRISGWRKYSFVTLCDNSEMRGFFAALRMTSEGQKQIPFGNDKQKQATAGPSTAFVADAPNSAQDDGGGGL